MKSFLPFIPGIIVLIIWHSQAFAAPAESSHGQHHENSHAGHMDMASMEKPAEPTIRTTIEPSSGISRNRPTTFTVSLKTQDGKAVTPADLVEMHTQKIHLLILDPSLDDYHHVHPVPTSMPGTYEFALTPSRSGQYKVFADLVPKATTQQEYSVAEFDVQGDAGKVTETTNTETRAGGLTFRIKVDSPPIKAGQDNSITMTVIGADGKPFGKLEPVMGAFAHFVAFSKDRAEVVHLHPMGAEPKDPIERGGPELKAHLKLSHPGYYRLFAQVQVEGRDLFAPFGLLVADHR
ncbi:MAG: hypothetical protein K1X53_01380 [Candidatus Sumerlaeaceae bacterium]|nr:hypothetical protein [Candidatus Sumerlaeaceae bacterium]